MPRRRLIRVISNVNEKVLVLQWWKNITNSKILKTIIPYIEVYLGKPISLLVPKKGVIKCTLFASQLAPNRYTWQGEMSTVNHHCPGACMCVCVCFDTIEMRQHLDARFRWSLIVIWSIMFAGVVKFDGLHWCRRRLEGQEIAIVSIAA